MKMRVSLCYLSTVSALVVAGGTTDGSRGFSTGVVSGVFVDGVTIAGEAIGVDEDPDVGSENPVRSGEGDGEVTTIAAGVSTNSCSDVITCETIFSLRFVLLAKSIFENGILMPLMIPPLPPALLPFVLVPVGKKVPDPVFLNSSSSTNASWTLVMDAERGFVTPS